MGFSTRVFNTQGPNICTIGNTLFFIDKSDPRLFSFHKLNQVLVDTRSAFQRIQILDTCAFGKALALDGFPQISSATNAEYTEAMVGVALVLHPKPRSALVLGGGDGAALALLHKDPWINKIVMVEIDGDVMALTQKHMPKMWDGAHLDTKRVTILTMDAMKYLRESNEFFDIIISDLTDPDEGALSTELMSLEYFKLLRAHLYLDGILMLQSGALTKFDYQGHLGARNLVETVFTELRSLNVNVPWFSTTWSFIMAGKQRDRLPRYWDAAFAQKLLHGNPSLSRHFRYLTPETMTALFAIDPAIPLTQTH